MLRPGWRQYHRGGTAGGAYLYLYPNPNQQSYGLLIPSPFLLFGEPVADPTISLLVYLRNYDCPHRFRGVTRGARHSPNPEKKGL